LAGITKSSEILNNLDYLCSKIMPFVDEDHQSISSLHNNSQALKLTDCTTPEDLYPLVLKTNVAIEHVNLVYTIRLFAHTVNLINSKLFFEIFKLPINMLLLSQKKH
jgi:hypothetical protein